jgi:phosphoglycolate phosphatase-like HAD superfamily hydrolase
VVFDADGVLVDTEPAWVAARRALFKRHGLRFGPEEERGTLGTGVGGAAQQLSALLGQPADWELGDDQVPAQLVQCGGYLSIRFTGYFERRIRGEQLSYELNAGQTQRP